MQRVHKRDEGDTVILDKIIMRTRFVIRDLKRTFKNDKRLKPSQT